MGFRDTVFPSTSHIFRYEQAALHTAGVGGSNREGWVTYAVRVGQHRHPC